MFIIDVTGNVPFPMTQQPIDFVQLSAGINLAGTVFCIPIMPSEFAEFNLLPQKSFGGRRKQKWRHRSQQGLGLLIRILRSSVISEEIFMSLVSGWELKRRDKANLSTEPAEMTGFVSLRLNCGVFAVSQIDFVIVKIITPLDCSRSFSKFVKTAPKVVEPAT